MENAPSKNYLLAEFTYPILPPHKGGAMWFYSLPIHDKLCHPAEKLYRRLPGRGEVRQHLLPRRRPRLQRQAPED